MKTFIAASLASAVLSLGGIASAAPPYFHQNHGHASNYGYPSSGYGTAQNYGGYQAYQSYPTYPQYGQQYGQSWNNSAYRTPAQSYDPVHGDYHSSVARPYQPVSQNYGNYNMGNGHFHGSSYGW